MRWLGAIGIGETPEDAEMVVCMEALNIMLKGWHHDGIGAWLNQETTLFLENEGQSYSIGSTGDHATASYGDTELAADASSGDSTIDVDSITGIADGDYISIELDDGTLQWTTVNGTPAGVTVTLDDVLTDDAAENNDVYFYTTKTTRPLRIFNVRFKRYDGTEIPVDIVPRQLYLDIPIKSIQTKVNQVYYDPTTTNGTLYVWGTCDDVRDKIVFTSRILIQDIDSITNHIDVPVDWLRAVKMNLALEVAPDFEKDPTQFQIVQAERALTKAKAFDREPGSYIFKLSRR